MPATSPAPVAASARSAAPPARRAWLAALPPTRFRDFSRPLAGAVLTLALFAILLLLASSAGYSPPVSAPSADRGDAAAYGRIVERMRAGEGYYAVAHAELRQGGYGTRSVFNWRLPTLSWLESRLPALLWANIVIGLAALGALLAAARLVVKTGDPAARLIVIPALVASLLACTTPTAAFFGEIVTGVLILASVAAYGLKRPAAGFLLALLALFIRELAAPYVVVCVVLACRDRRFGELAAWAAGLLLFAGYFAWHAVMVSGMLGAGDVGYPQGWVQFGGLGFVLATAAFNGAFIVAPLWVSAILLPLCLVGLAAWQGPGAARAGLAVAIYLAAFAVVGKPFNNYWGALYTPLMMLGLPFVPAALRDLLRAARARPAPLPA
jgi:hypothetical protein